MREIHDSGRGFAGLYEGFSSYILSRLSYLFIRNIVYKETYDVFKPFKPSNDLTTREKAVIAGFAGGLAAFITNPIELVNTRIICDGGIYKPHRRNYKGLADGFSSIL